MEYYIVLEDKRVGPFSVEELKKKNITRKTLVWREGMTDWAELKDVEELAELAGSIPPPMQNETEEPKKAQTEKPPMPKTWFVESIIVTLLCCLPFGIIGIIYSSKVEPLYYAGHYDEAAQKANQAKQWTLWGIGVCCILVILYLLALIAASILPFACLFGALTI